MPVPRPGQYEDAETGLYYNRFRYYDAESGQYASQDPIGLRGGRGIYAYSSRPLDRIDPLGLSERCGRTKTQVHAFGNKIKPRPPRPGKDIPVDSNGFVHPASAGEKLGASTAADPAFAPLTGHHHSLAAGTQLPDGIGIAADGADVGGSHFPGHHTIHPTRSMSYDDFTRKFEELPWQYSGKK